MERQTVRIPVSIIKYVYRYQKQLYFCFLLLSVVGLLFFGWEFFLGSLLASLYGLIQVTVSIVDSYNAGYQAAHEEELRKAFE